MSQPRTGFFWDVMEGRVPLPPAAALLGFELLEIDPEQGRLRARFAATERFLNPMGMIQGGILAAMLDDTMGPALAATLAADQIAPTLELKINFLRPAKPGVLVAEGRVVSKSSAIAFLAGELRDAGGELLATATATARILRAG
jgi:uncharacterized protein (TIGR00369 family)